MLPPPVASKPAYRAGQVTPKQRKPVRAPANFAIISPQVELLLDLFAGIPLSKPSGFRTDPVTLGFSVNWQY